MPVVVGEELLGFFLSVVFVISSVSTSLVSSVSAISSAVSSAVSSFGSSSVVVSSVVSITSLFVVSVISSGGFGGGLLGFSLGLGGSLGGLFSGLMLLDLLSLLLLGLLLLGLVDWLLGLLLVGLLSDVVVLLLLGDGLFSWLDLTSDGSDDALLLDLNVDGLLKEGGVGGDLLNVVVDLSVLGVEENDALVSLEVLLEVFKSGLSLGGNLFKVGSLGIKENFSEEFVDNLDVLLSDSVLGGV